MTSAVATGPMPVAVPAAATAVAAQLRCALVWRGEVMADHVARTDAPITLGTSPRSTFVVPELELPADFAILRPGPRGWQLTLGARMRGTVSIGGHEREVADFVRRGGEGGSDDGGASPFRTATIGGRDWGVVDLDPQGHHQLFFQFVPVEAPLPRRKIELELLLPALAFSLLLHTVLLAVTYSFEEDDSPIAYPGSAALTGRFLITRMADKPPEPPKAAAMTSTGATDQGKIQKTKAATKGKEGKAGGEGEGPRARDPDPVDDLPPAPKVEFLTEKNQAVLRQVAGTAIDLGRYVRLPGPRTAGNPGQGKGRGAGFGDDLDGTGNHRGSTGDGPGAGGNLEGDLVSKGKIDPGATRPGSGRGGPGQGGLKEAALVATGAASGDFGGLTKEEIDKVVKSRQNLIKSCYQRELDRSAGLGGKLVVSFTIAATGEVTRSKIDGGKSSLHNATVEDCVLRQINKLHFPAKGGGFVNYPFIFSQGG